MLSAPQVSLTRDHVLCQKAAHVAGNHLAIFFVRRSPRQREPIGDVRATVAYFAPSWLEMPFEIVPPSFSRRPAPRPSHRNTPDPSASRILSRTSRPRIAAPRLTALDCGVLPPRAGGAAIATREQRPPAGADGGSGEANMPLVILLLMASGHWA
jgi:hypothetical protein